MPKSIDINRLIGIDWHRFPSIETDDRLQTPGIEGPDGQVDPTWLTLPCTNWAIRNFQSTSKGYKRELNNGQTRNPCWDLSISGGKVEYMQTGALSSAAAIARAVLAFCQVQPRSLSIVLAIYTRKVTYNHVSNQRFLCMHVSTDKRWKHSPYSREDCSRFAKASRSCLTSPFPTFSDAKSLARRGVAYKLCPNHTRSGKTGRRRTSAAMLLCLSAHAHWINRCPLLPKSRTQTLRLACHLDSYFPPSAQRIYKTEITNSSLGHMITHLSQRSWIWPTKFYIVIGRPSDSNEDETQMKQQTTIGHLYRLWSTFPALLKGTYTFLLCQNNLIDMTQHGTNLSSFSRVPEQNFGKNYKTKLLREKN